MAYLRICTGRHAGSVVKLAGKSSVIGRRVDCDVILLDTSISRRHVEILVDGEHYVLQDLGSQNGTYLGGERVASRAALNDGDQFRLCDVVLTFHLGDPPPAELDAAATVSLDAPAALGITDGGSSSEFWLGVNDDSSSLRISLGQRRRAIEVLLIVANCGEALRIKAHLDEANGGFAIFTLEHAETLAEGLVHQRDNQFDVILVDLNLPDSEGLETLGRLQRAAPNAAIVVLTGQGDAKLAIEAINQGADDLLTKSEVDAFTLPRALRFAFERKHVQAVHVELKAAAKVQKLLLPRRSPKLAGFEIAGKCRPTETVAGDWFDYIPMPNGSLGVVMADVSGHGFGPALIMAGIRRLLRSLVQVHDDIGQILTIANRAVCEESDDGQFITLFFGKLTPRTRTFVYVSAGHPGYLFDLTGVSRRLSATSLPLGMLGDALFPPAEAIVLEPGQLLFLGTDGLHEASSPACPTEVFGLARTLDWIRANRHRRAREIVAELFSEIRGFCEPGVPGDDMTAIVVKSLQDS